MSDNSMKDKIKNRMEILLKGEEAVRAMAKSAAQKASGAFKEQAKADVLFNLDSGMCIVVYSIW